jgi:hypothetical protein
VRASREALAEMRQPRGAMQTLNHAAVVAVAVAVAVPVMRAPSRVLSGRHGHLQRNRLSLGVVRRRVVDAAGMIVVLVMLMGVAAGKPFPEWVVAETRMTRALSFSAWMKRQVPQTSGVRLMTNC